MVSSDTCESNTLESRAVANPVKPYPPQPLSHKGIISDPPTLKPYPLGGQILTYCVSNGTSTG
jgi:hypothetical protein